MTSSFNAPVVFNNILNSIFNNNDFNRQQPTNITPVINTNGLPDIIFNSNDFTNKDLQNVTPISNNGKVNNIFNNNDYTKKINSLPPLQNNEKLNTIFNNYDYLNATVPFIPNVPYVPPPPDPYLGAYAVFLASNFNTTTNVWKDASPNARDITATTGTYTKTTSTTGVATGVNNIFPIITGGNTCRLNFTTAQINDFTLFHISRCPSTTTGAIISGATTNVFFSGFWQNLKCGVSYMDIAFSL